MRAVNSLVLHHSACLEGTVESFRKEHKKRGFNDIGYHGVIGNGHGIPDGEFKPGRTESLDGAGVYGNNKGRLHVCLVGNFHRPDTGFTGPPTIAQFEALDRWLVSRGKQYNRPGKALIPLVGHKEIAIPGHATACPGSEFPIDIIRQWYQRQMPRVLAGGKPEVTLVSYLHACGYKYANVPPRNQVIVTVDGKPVSGVAIIKDGMTYVPARPLLDALGLRGDWDGDKQELTVRTK